MRTLALVSTLALLIPTFPTHAQVTCQYIGSQTYCSNGLNSQQIGNMEYYNNGVTRQRIGTFDYYSPPPQVPAPMYRPPVYQAPPLNLPGYR